jgi:hypothetical protein
MATSHVDAADYLRYLAEDAGHLLDVARDSLAANAYDQHQSAAQHAEHIDHVLELIQAAQHEIAEAAAPFNSDTYSDGRRISTTCEIEEGCYFTHTRHPDPNHHTNQPREICVVDCRDGARKRIVLLPDRSIEAVPIEPLRAVK